MKQAESPLPFSEFQHPGLKTKMPNTLCQPTKTRTVSLQTARDRSMSHGVNGSCSCLVLLYFSHATELAQMQHYSTSCAEAETDRICPSQTPLPSAHPPKAPCPLTSSLWGTTAQSEKLNANLSSRVHQKSIKSVRKQYPLIERRCR